MKIKKMNRLLKKIRELSWRIFNVNNFVLSDLEGRAEIFFDKEKS